MMNLEKMKQKKRTITKSRVKKSLLAATTFLCLTTPLLQTQTAYAAENTTPAITIEKPDGWKQGENLEIVRIIRAMDMSIPELEAFKKRMKNELPGRVEIQKEETRSDDEFREDETEEI